MTKRPSYQWYPGDFRRDTALQSCTFDARALWREMMDLMHDGEPYGHLTAGGVPIGPDELSRMTGLDMRRLRPALAELERKAVFSRTPEGIIYSRRMVRDELVRNARAAGGKLGGNPVLKGTAKVGSKVEDKVNLPPNLPPNLRPTPAVAVAVASASASLGDQGVNNSVAAPWPKTPPPPPRPRRPSAERTSPAHEQRNAAEKRRLADERRVQARAMAEEEARGRQTVHGDTLEAWQARHTATQTDAAKRDEP